MNHTGDDIATFSDGNYRKIHFSMQNLYFEPFIGKFTKNVFFNGLINCALFRKMELQSSYSRAVPDTAGPIYYLTGNYKTTVKTNIDLGLEIGLKRKFMLFSIRFYIPVYDGGNSDYFEDNSVEKKNLGLNRFPNNYTAYLSGQPYKGVNGLFNGVKLYLSVTFSRPVGGPRVKH